MSLINDMLKDLDRRNRQPAGAHVTALRGLGLTGARAHAPLTGHAIAVAGMTLLGVLLLAGLAISNNDIQPVLVPDITRLEATISEKLPLPELTARTSAVADTGTSGTKSSPASGPVAVTASGSEPRPGTAAASAAASQAALSAEVEVTDDTAHIEVIPRPLSTAQQLARDFHAAASAATGGNHAEAEHLLEELLARDKGHHQARLLLAGLYVQQQRNSRAESVLASGLLHYPQHPPYARMYAQLLAGQARDSEAISALQTALPAAGDDADYHALLAGLYQRSGNPAAAANSYRAALRLEPARGEWWMGMGISSEQAGDTETAGSAYRQALHYPLGMALQQYVRQRLEQLTQ